MTEKPKAKAGTADLAGALILPRRSVEFSIIMEEITRPSLNWDLSM